MSGRGQEMRGHRRWAGRGRGGRGFPPPARDGLKSETRFTGANPELPSLNYGAAQKENRPIEFLQLFGEHCAIKYKAIIAQAFWTSPPEFGEDVPEPEIPDLIPNTNVGKVMIADYSNDRKEWKAKVKKTEDHKKAIFRSEEHTLNSSHLDLSRMPSSA